MPQIKHTISWLVLRDIYITYQTYRHSYTMYTILSTLLVPNEMKKSAT